ncbi:MAG: U32 family peptidase [Lachnospiraceae bacterium]|nr:U32 family peptidase [Lachnospiraceae bacterium]
MVKELELLAPAGNLTTLKAVIHAGADAVYFGGSQFGARAYAGNFNRDEVLEAIDFGHIHGKKVFMAVNTLLKEKELEEQLYDYLLPYYEQGLDGVIVQDFGVLAFIREHFRELPIHTSTQMTVTNVEGARFLVNQGASRIVMAREMSLEEIRHIHESVPVEIESFVHGALCYCYSGQCLLSSMLGGRSGNRGRCAQPCRLPYEVYDANRKRINDNKHLYPLSPKDLCTIDQIPQLAENGIFSFKIEGRMKRTEYAAGVVSIYRKYMDKYLNYGAKAYHVTKEDTQKLFDFGNRSGFTAGYYNQRNGADMITFEKPGHEKNNDALWNQIEEKYIKRECKEKISGYLNVQKDMPISCTVCGLGHTITVTGDVPLLAEKQPISKEVLLSKMQKTGNTPFVFDTLEVTLDDDLFLPMAAVNELRRQALEQLEEAVTLTYRRQIEAKKSVQQKILPKKSLSEEVQITASVESESQIEPLLTHPQVSGIYIDSMVFPRKNLVEELQKLYEKAKKYKKNIYYILPAIFRKHTKEFYQRILPQLKTDGFLVKSYDALAFLLEEQIPPENIRIDHNVYTWSNQSKQAFRNLGIQKDTIPLELNRKELKARDNHGSEMLIYGYLPLMTSAQCINGNVIKCDGKSKIHYLKDRYGIYFPVKNHCSECYNIIYNSKPLYLFFAMEELQKMGIHRFRLAFTTESSQEIHKFLLNCTQSLQKNAKELENMEDYTYGHYKRGVE